MSSIEFACTGDGTARILINRPDRLNSFTPDMYRELRRCVRAAETDESVDVVLIAATGRAFATGGDIEAVDRALTGDDPLAIFDFEDTFPFDTIRDCEKVTIAAVNGMCFGSGLIIAALCDLVVAADKATFGIPEGLVGLADPFVPTALFTKIPTTRLKHLALTGERITAAEALEIGLVTKVVQEDELDTAVDALIAAVRRTTPTSRRYYKQYINALLPRAQVRDIYPPMLSPEGRAAIKAFVDRSRSG